MGEPVQHRIIDRRAQHLPEGRGTERRVIVDVAGLRPTILDHLVRQLVELEQVDAHGGRLAERGEDLTDEPPGWAHFLDLRSEEHTSELQSLMRISYAVFCLKKKKKIKHTNHTKF